MARTPASSPASSPTPGAGLHAAAWFALFCVAALVVYHPALHGGFIWDDDGHVTRADLRSLGGLFRIWFERGATQQYYPLLHSAFWLEHKLWGDAVLGYHLLNVLVHATAATLFGLVLRRLAVPGAWLAAGLFLLHPVCVESVAWISEQKNTLSLALYLCAALAYLRFDRDRSTKFYCVATAVFVLALLTKTITATLPAALLVVFWWQRGRLETRRDVLPLLPWFLLGAIGGLNTAHFERTLIGAEGADFALGFLDRLVLAGRVFWFYAGKLAWPADLTFIYPRWTIDASVWWQWLFPAAGAGLLAVLFWWRSRSRAPLAVALLFGGSLFPVLGFVNVYPFIFSYVADHFQYLASLAVFAAAGAALARLPRGAAVAAGLGLTALVGVLARNQADMYRDRITLYETTLHRNPESWLMHNNLAVCFIDEGRLEEGRYHLGEALRIRPNLPHALSNLGDVLTQLGRPAEALPPLERSRELQPNYPEVHNNLGNALAALGRFADAEAAYREAIKLRPRYATAHCNLGLAFAQQGRTAEALAAFERAVQIDPRYADAHLNWAVGLTLDHRFPEAVPHFEQALQVAPLDMEASLLYGRALAQAGRHVDAVVRFRVAIAVNPKSAEAHMDMALSLRALGQHDEANTHYREAVRLNPALRR